MYLDNGDVGAPPPARLIINCFREKSMFYNRTEGGAPIELITQRD